MDHSSRIFVAGHRGLVGSAVVRLLQSRGYYGLILRSRKELDLLDQAAVRDFFRRERIEYVFIAAARVGGIHANSTQPADFIYENLMIAANLLKAAADFQVEKVLYLGSSCIYPKFALQPIQEGALLTGPLEPTNEAYGIAKIAGLKLCEMFHRQYGKRFISAMPTNIYGPGDGFHPLNSHVIPGMMRRFHEAKERSDSTVQVWGSGAARREFLHVDDAAEALMTLMDRYESPETINVGSGSECSIAELALLIQEVTGFPGRIEFDSSKPEGTPRKFLDSSRMRALGWQPRRPLREGLIESYRWAVANHRLSRPPNHRKEATRDHRVPGNPA